MFQFVYAEPIFITESNPIKDVIFDGKWTNYAEWKASSLFEIQDHPNLTYIRAAHNGEYIYIMIDPIWDKTIDKISDRSIICFDTNNDKSDIPKNDDYCFIATLGTSNGKTLQGGSPFILQDYFSKISNPEGFIAIGSASDENDRYEKITHTSYEFKIPTKFIGRSDNYGFFVYVYDSTSDTTATYPSLVIDDKRQKIPSPSVWGDLISPDKSLPEFGIPMILFSLGIISTIVLLAFKNPLRYKIKV